MLGPSAAIPLALTSLSGAIDGTVLSFNCDAPWLLRLRTGNFVVVNLQPFDSPLIGVITLMLIVQGALCCVEGQASQSEARSQR